MIEIIFYFGSIIIVVWYVYVLVQRFKEEDKIDLKKHFWIILVYVILLVVSIIAWRVIYLLLISSTDLMINYNSVNYNPNIENLIDG